MIKLLLLSICLFLIQCKNFEDYNPTNIFVVEGSRVQISCRIDSSRVLGNSDIASWYIQYDVNDRFHTHVFYPRNKSISFFTKYEDIILSRIKEKSTNFTFYNLDRKSTR